MKYKRFILFFLFCLTLSYACPAAGEPEKGVPKVKASAVCLMDVTTGQIYFEKEGNKRREPASLTKIMTAILAIENGNLKDIVTVGKRAASVSMGQDIGLRTGDRLYLEDLLKAALLYSANDSTVAIGEHIGGSHEVFIKMMNDKAKALGMKNTSFANTNGYHHPNHYTTANDLAILTCYALKNPTFAELVKTKEVTITWLPPEDNGTTDEKPEEKVVREKILHSTNRLLESDFEGINGVKTGTTPRAGNCLIASATREGRQLVAVILNSQNRWDDATGLLDYGFNDIKPVALVEKSEYVDKVPVEEGVEKEVRLVAANKVEVYLPPGELELVQKKIHKTVAPKAPITKGTKLGTVTYLLKDKEIASVDLVANQDIERLPWYRRIFE